MFCHVTREAAPAAAGFRHPVARFQLQLAADVVHLGALRLLQRQVRRREIGAGVLHGLAVEPHFVEFVADVVMVMDVVARIRDTVQARAIEQTRLGVLEFLVFR